MSARPTYSKATIAGHPIHPMIVGFPIAFYTAALFALIVHAVTESQFAYRLSYLGFLVGAGLALIAAIFGLIDLSGVPQGSPAQRTGWTHAALNVLAALLFGGAGAMLYADRAPAAPGYTVPLVLAVVGFAFTLGGGWLGWRLVQTHHVGVDDRPAQVRDPSGPPRRVERGVGERVR